MAMTSRINQYWAGAARCELRAKKARNQDDREWQLRLARGYRALAEAEAERSALLEIDPVTPADIDEAREVQVFQSTGGVRVQHGEEWGKKQGKASAEGYCDANG